MEYKKEDKSKDKTINVKVSVTITYTIYQPWSMEATVNNLKNNNYATYQQTVIGCRS
jgi:hypothetical protein